jgi:hypothetical protein
MFFYGADDHHVIRQIPHHLQLKLLPADDRFFHQDLGNGAGLQAGSADLFKLLLVVSHPTTGAPQGIGRADDEGIADLLGNLLGFFQGVGQARAGHGQANPLHGLLEEIPVFGFFNGLPLGPNQLHPVLLQDPLLGQLHRHVEGRLAAHGGQQRHQGAPAR